MTSSWKIILKAQTNFVDETAHALRWWWIQFEWHLMCRSPQRIQCSNNEARRTSKHSVKIFYCSSKTCLHCRKSYKMPALHLQNSGNSLSHCTSYIDDVWSLQRQKKKNLTSLPELFFNRNQTIIVYHALLWMSLISYIFQ